MAWAFKNCPRRFRGFLKHWGDLRTTLGALKLMLIKGLMWVTLFPKATSTLTETDGIRAPAHGIQRSSNQGDTKCSLEQFCNFPTRVGHRPLTGNPYIFSIPSVYSKLHRKPSTKISKTNLEETKYCAHAHSSQPRDLCDALQRTTLAL